MEKKLLCIWQQWVTGHIHPTNHDINRPKQRPNQRAGTEQLLSEQRSPGSLASGYLPTEFPAAYHT